MSTEVPLGKVGGVTVNVGMMGVSGNGVDVIFVAVAIISVGVAIDVTVDSGVEVKVIAGIDVWVAGTVFVGMGKPAMRDACSAR